ncbi:FAM192A_Fyv6_N domain-containing protein [Pycnococcus provasolii]
MEPGPDSSGQGVPLVHARPAAPPALAQQQQQSTSRPSRSVFPSKFAAQAEADASALRDSVLGATGGRKFVTEGSKVAPAGEEPAETGTGRYNSLAEALEKQKEAKQSEYEERGRLMKQGANKPLEEDEVEFLDHTREEDAARERATKRREEEELRHFRALRALHDLDASTAHPQAAPAAPAATARAPPSLAPRVRVVKRVAKDQPAAEVKAAALSSLVAAYGSDSDDND